MRPRMDAAGAVDAQTAPTAPWKTAQTAVSHSAHTLNRFLGEHEDDHASHTEFLTLPACDSSNANNNLVISRRRKSERQPSHSETPL